MTWQSLHKTALDVYHLAIPPRIDREIRRATRIEQTSFPKALNLPGQYGRKMSERVVEILVARLTYNKGMQVLDVGHANVIDAHLRMLRDLPAPLHITGIDITEPRPDVRAQYSSSVVANITASGFPENSFDLIWCISALEHFGMDNSVYTDTFTLDTQMDKQALKEMMRIVKRGGTIVITLPFGKFENHEWLKNFDYAHLQELLSVAESAAVINNLFFKYSATDGWKSVAHEELAKTGYLDHDNGGASGLVVAHITKK
jgi:ubiquinone/menaquinone biosynthesis C-methylase UbiE